MTHSQGPDDAKCGRAGFGRAGKVPGVDPSRKRFEDEALAPEIDCDLLTALVRRQLPDEQARLVYHLVETFRSWNDAHAEILAAEFRRRSG